MNIFRFVFSILSITLVSCQTKETLEISGALINNVQITVYPLYNGVETWDDPVEGYAPLPDIGWGLSTREGNYVRSIDIFPNANGDTLLFQNPFGASVSAKEIYRFQLWDWDNRDTTDMGNEKQLMSAIDFILYVNEGDEKKTTMTIANQQMEVKFDVKFTYR
jgi:hypothetical protein